MGQQVRAGRDNAAYRTRIVNRPFAKVLEQIGVRASFVKLPGWDGSPPEVLKRRRMCALFRLFGQRAFPPARGVGYRLPRHPRQSFAPSRVILSGVPGGRRRAGTKSKNPVTLPAIIHANALVPKLHLGTPLGAKFHFAGGGVCGWDCAIGITQLMIVDQEAESLSETPAFGYSFLPADTPACGTESRSQLRAQMEFGLERAD